jgi:hypothetical protein
MINFEKLIEANNKFIVKFNRKNNIKCANGV